jgi:3-phenylpropionate/trans-cinnamate dioxygenase ferredoxin reductase subunit
VIRHFDIAIVGTGHAGAQAAASLRQGGFTGSIGLIGAEDEPPYDRPSLSKDYLAGIAGSEDIRMRPADFWAGRDITLVPGTRIVQVDAAAHRLLTGTGEAIGYGRMLWAAGGAATDLPGCRPCRAVHHPASPRCRCLARRSGQWITPGRPAGGGDRCGFHRP